MPELPEVETVCKGLAQSLLKAKVLSAKAFTPKLRIEIPQDLDSQLKNKTIKSINRKAKYILIEFADIIIIAHLGMSGRMTIEDSKSYERKKHDHIIIKLKLADKSEKLLILNDPRRFGIFTLSSPEDIKKHKLFSKLGLEPFSKDFTWQALAKIFKNRTKNIKATIMDSSLIVGVGNIYACESLFRSEFIQKGLLQVLTKQKSKNYIKRLLKL